MSGAVRYETVPAAGARWHELADLFPWMEDGAFRELVEDVRANGVIEPIIFHEGKILDGRNRYMAAVEVGCAYPRVDYDGDDPLAFVIAKNLHRRHLTESQRAMVAARLAKMPRGSNQHGPRGDHGEDPQICGSSAAEAAEKLNVSPRSVETARTVQRDGAPELMAAVDAGAVSVAAAAEVAKLPKEQQAEIVAEGPAAVRGAASDLRKGKAPVRGTAGTGDNEWFTPAEFLDRARRVLGGIDLDPASHPIAQERVGAGRFFTVEDDGLAQEWRGRVWLNPPYAQPAIAHFANKAVTEYSAGRVQACIVLTHNYTDTAWFQKLAGAASAICFTRGRIRFEAPDGTLAAPTQGQAFFYLGTDVAAFAREFTEVGLVLLPSMAMEAANAA